MYTKIVTVVLIALVIDGCQEKERIVQTSENEPPNAPAVVSPPEGATGVSRSIAVRWSATDPDSDLLKFDVYFDVLNPPSVLAASDVQDMVLTRSGLDSNRAYYWRVVAKDNHSGVTAGNVWTFVTGTGLEDDLAAYFPFNGNAQDASGNGNHALVVGATLTSDRFNNPQAAYDFDGIGNYIEVPNSASLHLDSLFTICAWVYPSGFYGGRCQGNAIVWKGLTQDEPGTYWIGYSDDLVVADCGVFTPNDEHFGFALNTDGLHRTAANDTMRIAPGRWYFVSGTYDGTAMRAYVNGQLQNTILVSGTLATNSRNIRIGASENSSYPYWVNGKIDDVRIYRRALGSDEIQRLYLGY